MQKNWYVVYTKPHYEKKLVSLFTKRKIENFCPQNWRKIKSFRHSKILREPLFKSYVFVNITPAEIAPLKRISGVTNILHWRNEPAIIKQDEIDAIKEFAGARGYIELNRMQVNMHDVVRFVDNTSYSMEGNVFIIKNKALKVSLPSLGYIMTVKIEEGSFFGTEAPHKSIRPEIADKAWQQ